MERAEKAGGAFNLAPALLSEVATYRPASAQCYHSPQLVIVPTHRRSLVVAQELQRGLVRFPPLRHLICS